MVSIKDVAAEARVSPQTVSNYFNQPEIVKDMTRKKVESAVEKLRYTPNASARRLRTRKSNTLAIGIAPTGYSPIYDLLLHALVSEADRSGLRIMLYNTDSKTDEIRQYRSLIAGGDVDCFILTDTEHHDPRIAWLTDHRQAFVLFGRPWGHDLSDPDIAWVDVDGRRGIADMTRHLILTGHRHIGFLGWPEPSGTGTDRKRGWQETMEQAKLCDPSSISDYLAYSQDDIRSGQIACRELMSRKTCIDAIVCVSDTLATGALTSLPHSTGIAVTGFDNTAPAQSLGFPSLEQPTQDIAHELVRIAMERIRRIRNETHHTLLAPRLITR
jgi:DNA-binding LacI/PurR family transcriptional regulator